MKIPNEPFFIVPSRVFTLGLNPYELSVLCYLLMRADNEKHSCWPSESSIAKECGMGKRTVRNALNSLKEKELLNVVPNFMTSKNGKNRQTANHYTLLLYKDMKEEMGAGSASAGGVEYHPPKQMMPPPEARDAGEINKTKSNITKSNITKSTELTLADAEEVLKERNSFLELKKNCFEGLKKEYSLEEDYVLLIDRALEHLWHKRSMAYEGKEYSKEAIQTILATGITPSMLNASVGYFERSSEPVRSPVAYIAKCIFGMLVNGECPTASGGKSATSLGSASASLSGGASAVNTVSAKPKREESVISFGSLEVDDFFAAALKRTYGDDVAL